MSVCDMMEVDGVRGQAWVTFTGVLTAVPTGCCQATPHPHWPLSTLPHFPTPVSPGCHTFASQGPQKISLPSRDQTAPRARSARLRLQGFFFFLWPNFEGWTQIWTKCTMKCFFPSKRVFFFIIYLICLVVKCHGVALPSGSASQIITYTLQMRV